MWMKNTMKRLPTMNNLNFLNKDQPGITSAG
jgi:hypothetical protein